MGRRQDQVSSSKGSLAAALQGGHAPKGHGQEGSRLFLWCKARRHAAESVVQGPGHLPSASRLGSAAMMAQTHGWEAALTHG